MKKIIVRAKDYLKEKSIDANQEDQEIIQDLKDTFNYHKHECVGLAANMIGYKKKMMIIQNGTKSEIIINPEIIKVYGNKIPMIESCLSLEGSKPTQRYPKIKIKYLDEQFRERMKTYSGLAAQAIQHEMDHFEGILV